MKKARKSAAAKNKVVPITEGRAKLALPLQERRMQRQPISLARALGERFTLGPTRVVEMRRKAA